ncbi:group II intron maturase-specific domain-containing protein, partial [Kitasatospora sp. NPDC056531]|uniref:group II intron maturase-specific domain-containing protein n=1 Tax=Kitasatospora sp. NPDC056531 TaxID=3345856 RepID=UPI003680F05F
ESRMRENRMSGLMRRGLETETHPPRQSPTLLDLWMARTYPGVRFERYCDDVVVHCRSEAEAHRVRGAIAGRLAECGGLLLHPDKTRIVYCRDGKRRGSYEHTSFTFLGYGFRVRMVRTKRGAFFFSFNPAVSDEAAKQIRAQIRRWRLHLRSGQTLEQLAREINPVVRGWINYYGRFFPSALVASLNRINDYLVRWLVQKYKRFRGRWMRARDALGKHASVWPGLFAHWKLTKP